MTYLRYRYALSGLPPPPTVALHTGGVDWIDAQVAAEFALLFPDSAVAVNPSARTPFALHVLVYLEAMTGLNEILAWGRRHEDAAQLALGFYGLDPRRFDVVPLSGFTGWARRRRLEKAGIQARLRFPRIWARFSSLYGRCASFF